MALCPRMETRSPVRMLEFSRAWPHPPAWLMAFMTLLVRAQTSSRGIQRWASQQAGVQHRATTPCTIQSAVALSIPACRPPSWRVTAGMRIRCTGKLQSSSSRSLDKRLPSIRSLLAAVLGKRIMKERIWPLDKCSMHIRVAEMERSRGPERVEREKRNRDGHVLQTKFEVLPLHESELNRPRFQPSRIAHHHY